MAMKSWKNIVGRTLEREDLYLPVQNGLERRERTIIEPTTIDPNGGTLSNQLAINFRGEMAQRDGERHKPLDVNRKTVGIAKIYSRTKNVMNRPIFESRMPL